MTPAWLALGMALPAGSTRTAAGPLELQAPAATRAETEERCRLLLDTPLLVSEDWRETALGRLARLRAEPGHPLAEAELMLLADEIGSAGDPSWVARELLELGELPDATPALRRRLDETRARAGALVAGRRDPDSDPYPGHLRRFWCLGPLEPRGHARGWQTPSPLWSDPGFGSEHAGASGRPLEWVLAERPRWSEGLRPLPEVDSLGQVWVACLFDVPEGGPAWVEIEAAGLGGWAGRDFQGFVPGYGFSLDGEPPRFVHAGAGERSELEAFPVVLRSGRNRILLRSGMAPGARLGFSVRVLAASGDRTYPGLQEAEADAWLRPLGPELPEASPPPPEWDPGASGAIAHLSALPDPGPLAQALMGTLLALDHRPIEGLDLLQTALERAGDEPWLAARTALALQVAPHLPATWREGRSRELALEVVERQPEHLEMQLLLAEIQAGEDREEEALERLDLLVEAHPGATSPLLLQRRVLAALGLEVRAEAALDLAASREPGRPATLLERAHFLEGAGQPSAAAAVFEEAARAAGAPADLLHLAAEQHLRVGRLESALALLAEAAQADPELELARVSALIDAGRHAEAEAGLQALAAVSPHASRLAGVRARLALERGDRDGEVRALLAVLSDSPSDRPARLRLAELGVRDPCADFLEGELLDVDEVLAARGAGGSGSGGVGRAGDESVVALIDHAVVWVFADGATERITQNLQLARDLAGCETLGQVQVAGEALAIATIDGESGARREPVLVGDAYVMPDLEPGDLVESTWRTTGAPPADGHPRLGGWFFASLERDFELSRYVVSLPEGDDLRWERGNLEAVRETTRVEDGRRVFEFVAERMRRVAPEPALPAAHAFLPWVELGADVELERIVALLRSEAEWASTPVPAVRRLAERIAGGLQGDEARARALHAHLADALDQRAWQPAAPEHALLARRGNPWFLYLSLLRALDVPAELVWSRGVTPAADDEPEPRFLDFGYWRRMPLVRVLPRDGPEAWCDLSPDARRLPYGRLIGQFSAASALSTATGEILRTPTIPVEERPSNAFEGAFAVAADGSARVEGRYRPRGGRGWILAEQARLLPENEVLANLRSLSARLVPGFVLEHYELEGLEDQSAPLAIAVEGDVRAFLDRSPEGRSPDKWVTRLPLVPLELSARFAGQGARRLPFRLPGPILTSATVRLELPEELTLFDPPAGLQVECAGGSYRLSVLAEGGRAWRIEREVAIEVFDLAAHEFDGFREFCARVDEAERARLRLR